MSELHPDTLTWAGLLAQWVDFARASLALPDDAEGRGWRDSVAPIINLQAVTFALADLARLPRDDHAVARDRAEFMIDRAESDLAAAWGDEPMPESILEITRDARMAVALVQIDE